MPTLQPFETCGIRPPTENSSLSFKITRNCYWNKCTFCPVYKFGSRFSKRPKDAVKKDIHHLMDWHAAGANTCFIGDADAMAVTPDDLSDIIRHATRAFPTLDRFTVYGQSATRHIQAKLMP